MKSDELFKQIQLGIIKDGTKIKVIDSEFNILITTVEYQNGRINWEPEVFNTSYFCNAKYDFVVEEDKELKEIKELEMIKIPFRTISGTIIGEDCYPAARGDIHNKLNEVIRAVNMLIKENK